MKPPDEAESHGASPIVLDLRMKGPSKAFIMSLAVGFYPVVLFVKPLVWLGRKLNRQPTWEIVIAHNGVERAEEFRSLGEAHRKAAKLESAAGTHRVLDRRLWTPIEVLLTIGAVTIFVPPIQRILSLEQVVAIALSIAAVSLVLAFWIWGKFAQGTVPRVFEIVLAAVTAIGSISMIVVSMLGGELIAGAVLLITAGIIVVESMKRIMRTRARHAVENPNVVTRITWT